MKIILMIIIIKIVIIIIIIIIVIIIITIITIITIIINHQPAFHTLHHPVNHNLPHFSLQTKPSPRPGSFYLFISLT